MTQETVSNPLTGSASAQALSSDHRSPHDIFAPTPLWLRLIETFLIGWALLESGAVTFALSLVQGVPLVQTGTQSSASPMELLHQVGALGVLAYVAYRNSHLGRAKLEPSGEWARQDPAWLPVLELVLVVFSAYSVSIASSFVVLLLSTPAPVSASFTELSWPAYSRGYSYSCFSHLADLSLLAYVLYRSGRNFAHIGLHWTSRDVALALPLGLAAFCLYLLVRPAAAWVEMSLNLDGLDDRSGSFSAIEHPALLTSVVMLFLNGFNEELVVRGFLMTQMRKFVRSALLVIFASVAVQVSYHFYQGAGWALTHIGWALLYAGFYWRTNRILPVVLAHNFLNFTLLLARGMSPG